MHPNAELYPWISAGALAWGMLDCFFGYRIFKLSLAVMGGLTGSVFGQAVGAALGLGAGGEIGALIVGGLLGAGLAYLMYFAAVFLAGFLFGLALGILLLANFNPMVAWMSGCVIGVIGGFLAIKLQRALIMLSTALVGAFIAMLGLSYFINRMDWLYYLRHLAEMPVLIEGNAWLLPAILALALVGVIAQFELGRTGAVKKAKTKDE